MQFVEIFGLVQRGTLGQLGGAVLLRLDNPWHELLMQHLVALPVSHIARQRRAAILGAAAKALPLAAHAGQLGLQGSRLPGPEVLSQALGILLQVLQGDVVLVHLAGDCLKMAKRAVLLNVLWFSYTWLQTA